MPDITVRAATEREYPAIARIQQRCPAAAQWPVGDYSVFSVLIARAGSEPAGFCAWRQTAREEAELLNLAVDPDWRGRGIASALLDALMSEAQGEIFLEVAESNAPAISLYRKKGWQSVGLRSAYYHSEIAAIVMKKSSW
jgi:ribosomal-protein-alanine N-acetyltransferase